MRELCAETKQKRRMRDNPITPRRKGADDNSTASSGSTAASALAAAFGSRESSSQSSVASSVTSENELRLDESDDTLDGAPF